MKHRSLPIPRNAECIRAARARGQRPADPVMVSFVGPVCWQNPTVYAESGQRYDWTWASGLGVFILVRPGVDASAAIRDIFEIARLYPAVVDVDSQRMAYLTAVTPRPKFWRVQADEAEFFACS